MGIFVKSPEILNLYFIRCGYILSDSEKLDWINYFISEYNFISQQNIDLTSINKNLLIQMAGDSWSLSEVRSLVYNYIEVYPKKIEYQMVFITMSLRCPGFDEGDGTNIKSDFNIQSQGFDDGDSDTETNDIDIVSGDNGFINDGPDFVDVPDPLPTNLDIFRDSNIYDLFSAVQLAQEVNNLPVYTFETFLFYMFIYSLCYFSFLLINGRNPLHGWFWKFAMKLKIEQESNIEKESNFWKILAYIMALFMFIFRQNPYVRSFNDLCVHLWDSLLLAFPENSILSRFFNWSLRVWHSGLLGFSRMLNRIFGTPIFNPESPRVNAIQTNRIQELEETTRTQDNGS